MMFRRQAHQDVGVRSPDRRRVAIREIDSAVWQPNVVDNRAHFLLWYLFANRVLYQISQAGSLLDARPGRRPQVKFELTAIYRGKEVLPQPRHQSDQREHTNREEAEQKHPPMPQAARQR